MTAEIVISNKHGVVLAADSAVTLSGDGKTKVYNSARKLFSIDGHNVGLMTYGNADLNKVPIDLLFKLFADSIRKKELESLQEYYEEFLDFIRNEEIVNDRSAETSFVSDCIIFMVNWIQNQMRSKENPILSQEPIEVVVERNFYQSVDELIEILDSQNQVSGFENIDSYIRENYNSLNVRVFNHSFPALQNRIDGEKVLVLLIKFLKSDLPVSKSGIVIAGYGKSDRFPAHHTIEISGVINGNLRITSYHTKSINVTDEPAEILPLAQTDVVESIIHGMDSSFVSHFIETINKHDLSSRQKQSMINDIESYKKQNFTNPMIDIVKLLPLEEVANVASTLINLTSFKRKFSHTEETVGGPIDVLVISKIDGPIWIERKHYFDIDKNLSFRIKKGGHFQ